MRSSIRKALPAADPRYRLWMLFTTPLAELSEILTGAKDAYTPMDDAEPKIEVDNNDSGVSTPLVEGLDSRTGTPAPGTPSEGSLYKHKPDDMRVETERLSKLALSVGAEDRPTPIEPLSTRFRPASPGMGSLPRVDFATSQTPTLGQDTAQPAEGETAYGNPFGTPHAELGIPPMPLFRIDQLGVDRRMVSTGDAISSDLHSSFQTLYLARSWSTGNDNLRCTGKSNSSRMIVACSRRMLTSNDWFGPFFTHRIWMQVKARKLV